jgi:hypothetical protein
MKILKLNSVRAVIGVLLLILSISFTSAFDLHDAPAPAALKKNQVGAYPNTFEAPTMAAQVPKSNYQPPKLSASLREADPTRKLRKPEFMSTIKYALYQITRGELEQIFLFADQNKDDTVDHTEWEAFLTLFVLPFESCDKKGENLLGEDEFKSCFDADPKTKLVQFRRRFDSTKYSLIMRVISTRGANLMNFADYLFVRKALFGWQQCQSNSKFIAKSHFKCALNAAIPQTYNTKLDIMQIYDTGLYISADKNLIELDFISYLRILHYTYVFGMLNVPGDTPMLEKQNFIKAIREDRIPTNFEESEVEYIYNLINNSPTVRINKVDQIDFRSWSFFYNLHNLFNTYSMEKPLHLSLGEMNNMLNDIWVDRRILNAIDDSNTNMPESEYQEASLILQRYRLNEKDFFNIRFKQDASVFSSSFHNKTTVFANYTDVYPNRNSRDVFFSIFTKIDKKYWLKEDMYIAFQLANVFVELNSGLETPISKFLELLPNLYDSIKPPINMMQRSNYVIYKILPREIKLDCLGFLALENFYRKFKIQSMSSNIHVDETTVKIILKDFGMGMMPDTVIDVSQKGFDSLHRRQYNPLDIAKNSILVHAIASENVRDAAHIKKHGLKLNADDSRAYNDPKRRFMSSPKV